MFLGDPFWADSHGINQNDLYNGGRMKDMALTRA